MQHLYRATLGLLRRSRSVGGVMVTESDYPAGSQSPRHEHTSAYLCLVLRGGYRQLAGGRSSECMQGLLLVHPEGHQHANWYAPGGARCINLHLDHVLDDDPAIPRLLGEHRALRLLDAARLGPRIGDELFATDAAADLALHAAVFELVACACRELEPHRARNPAWLVRVDERLHDDPGRAPSLCELAALAGVHPAHLARAFHRIHGMSVGEYARRLRIEHARAALIATRDSIAAIAAGAGFADQSHFARVFRRVTGETPLAWRQRMQIRS